MIQLQNLPNKVICRRNYSCGRASFQIIGETHFFVDVNEADLWICVCGHCLRCSCRSLTRPQECLYLPKSNGFLSCVPNGLSINMCEIPEALTSSLLSASHTKVKAFKPSAQLCATYSIFRETSANLKNEFHCCVSSWINSYINDTQLLLPTSAVPTSQSRIYLHEFIVKSANYYLLFSVAFSLFLHNSEQYGTPYKLYLCRMHL